MNQRRYFYWNFETYSYHFVQTIHERFFINFKKKKNKFLIHFNTVFKLLASCLEIQNLVFIYVLKHLYNKRRASSDS